eukprot:gene17150-19642_t
MTISLFGLLLLLILVIHSNLAETLVEKTDAIAEAEENSGVSFEIKDAVGDNTFNERFESDLEPESKDIEDDIPSEISQNNRDNEASNLDYLDQDKTDLHNEATTFEEEDVLEKIVEEVKRVTEEQSQKRREEPHVSDDEEPIQSNQVPPIEVEETVPVEEKVILAEYETSPLEAETAVIEEKVIHSIEVERVVEQEELQSHEESPRHTFEYECDSQEKILPSSRIHSFSTCVKNVQNRLRHLFEGFFSRISGLLQKFFRFRFR